MGASVVDVAGGERGWSDVDSRNSRIDSRVRARGRVTMVSECLFVIDGESAIVVVVVV